jgi:hypothetical protein
MASATQLRQIGIGAGILVLISLFFYLPLLQNKRIIQYDQRQIDGIGQNVLEYNLSQPDSVAHWSMSAFSGLPAVAVHEREPGWHAMQAFNSLFSHTLPGAFSYQAIGMLAAFFLGLALGASVWVSVGAAVGFAFFSYYIHITEAGHMSKLMTLMTLPGILLGMVHLFSGRVLLGALLTFLFTGLGIYNGHVQMLYYFALPAIAVGLHYVLQLAQQKQWAAIGLRTGVLLGAVALGILINYSRLANTADYSKVSTRSPSELAPETEARINPGAADSQKQGKNTALDREYAYGWSHGRQELLTLLVPNAQGGASQDRVPKGGKLLEMYGNNPNLQGKAWPTYWGPQAFTSGPYYLGAVLLFLCILGLLLDRSVLKWGLLYASLLLVILALGKYSLSIPQTLALLAMPVVFMLTHKFVKGIPKPLYGILLALAGYLLVQILPNGGFPDGAYTLADWCMDNLPMYDRFRAPASMLALLPLCALVLALLGIRALQDGNVAQKTKLQALYVAAGVPLALSLLMAVAPGLFFDSFRGPGDARVAASLGNQAQAFLAALEADRKTLLSQDAWRSFGFILLAAGMLWLWLTARLKQAAVALGAVGALIIIDMFVVDMRYLWRDGYEPKTEANVIPFEADLLLKERLKQEYFRVYPMSQRRNPFNDGITPYTLFSVGGYSAIKVKRYQQLIEAHLSKFNRNVVNMLNTGYIIHNPGIQDPSLMPVLPKPTSQGEMIYANLGNYGAAWITPQVRVLPRPDDVLLALDSINSRQVALLEAKDRDRLGKFDTSAVDSTEQVRITGWRNNHMHYAYNSPKTRFVTFSEVYYKNWKLYLDKVDPANELPILHTNFVLRGAVVPAGKHTLIFVCDNPVLARGKYLTTGISVLFVLALAGYLGMAFRKGRKKPTDGSATQQQA